MKSDFMVKHEHLHLVCYFIIPLNASVTSVVQMLPTLPKKWPYSEFFWSVFPAFELNTEIFRADLSPNAVKYGLERTPNTDTFYAV